MKIKKEKVLKETETIIRSINDLKNHVVKLLYENGLEDSLNLYLNAHKSGEQLLICQKKLQRIINYEMKKTA